MGKTTRVNQAGYIQERDSAPYAADQKNPQYRRALKKLIERGTPRHLAREAARRSVYRPKMKVNDTRQDEE